MTSSPNVIFTYGTLRPGLGDRPEAQAFRATARLLGPATFQGKLYAIDWYPAAVDSDAATDVITGDLYQIGENADFFDKLDAYEGCSSDWPTPHEYIRTIRNVQYGNQTTSAWIYLFNWEITDQLRIKSGDFADHVAAKR
jgi:gamma-glutamylcyclotransferase (GGCT)/AIG2-like uncharacterized protein YtfP